MNIKAYLFTINKNNSFKLNTDDLKDVEQEINIFLINKDYNDLLLKKTVLSHYLKWINKQGKYDRLENEIIDGPEIDLNEKRRIELKKLKLNEKQKKIIALLIEGYTYPEIRKRLKLNENKLKSHIKRIRQNNIK